MNVDSEAGEGGVEVGEERLLAITREVSVSLDRCELSHQASQPIDLDRARDQHRGYVAALAEAGVEVVTLPPEDAYPDAVFVEDTAVVTDEVAVITRPGAASRRGEVESVSRALADHRPLVHIQEPGTLDGGDVLRVGRFVYVGLSGRTNLEGYRQLKSVLGRFGYLTREMETRGCLHLKSACASLGDGVVLLNPRWVNPSCFPEMDLLVVPEAEPDAANLLRVGESLLVSDAYPRTLEMLQQAGFDPRPVTVSEFHKAEGGLTCMSVILRRLG